jgi:hypothetical protein
VRLLTAENTIAAAFLSNELISIISLLPGFDKLFRILVTKAPFLRF